MPELVKSSKFGRFHGLSPFMVLFGEQPAGTTAPPTGILEETRDYYKSEWCATRIEEGMKFFYPFTGEKSTVSSSTQNKLLILLSLLLIQKWAIRYCCFPLQKMNNWPQVF